MKNLMLIALLVSTLLSCKKDKDEDALVSTTCEEDSMSVTHFQYPLVSYLTGNPNNSDEIAFLRDKFASTCCKQEIVVYNMSTKTIKSIYEGTLTAFDWGKNGWIIFNDEDGQQVFKILPTGDSLTQVTTYGHNGYPKWNRQGTAFICNYSSPTYDSSGIRIYSENGELMNDDLYWISYFTWHHDSLIVTPSQDFDMQNATINLSVLRDAQPSLIPFRYIIYLNQPGIVHSCEWIDDNRMAVTLDKGLYIINFSSPNPPYIESNIQLVEETCVSTGYNGVTVDRFSNKLLLERYWLETNAFDQVIRHTHFVRMNFDGTNEEIIEIPGL